MYCWLISIHNACLVIGLYIDLRKIKYFQKLRVDHVVSYTEKENVLLLLIIQNMNHQSRI